MSILAWRVKRKLTIFFIVFLVVGILAGLWIYFYLPEPTCFDGKENQDEEGVDCGGSCTPCVASPKNVITLWTRVFKVSDGVYEAAALIENPNIFYGLSVFKYTFKLYDVNNVLVAIKDNQTFLNPRDKFVIWAGNLQTGKSEAVRAFFEIETVSPWRYIDEEIFSVLVSEKTFTNTPFPVLRAKLVNQSILALENISVAAVLYDENENAMAVSSTKIDSIPGESGQEVVFTWPMSFAEEPVSSEIFVRVNLSH
ncbi:hypothetical protein ACFL1O_00585 [Patescibacteria group bacterium]